MSKPKRARRAAPKKKTTTKKKPAAKKTARTAVKAKNVDGYVASLPPPMQTVVNRLRALVAAASPEAIESFKWGQPVYEASGPFAYIKAHKSYVNFGFWRGAVLEAPASVTLEGDGSRMRHLKIPDAAAINEEAIKTLVQQAVLLNSRLGNPTQR